MVTTCSPPDDPGELHPALTGRFSPQAFDPRSTMTERQVDLLLDAARLAPSAGNSQPWSFIAALRDDVVHRRLMPLLAPSSTRWAADASLLVVNLAHARVADSPEWQYSEFSQYDLGQAVAHMTMQALALGLAVRQFRAFDRDAIAREFEVPTHMDVTSMSAFGVAAHDIAGSLPGSRSRRTRRDVVWVRAESPDESTAEG
ncbi:nitroreductase family protein [Gordonia hankookensis]|uniref:Nitroreductase family protein n=1 Tax=Gordonia hankookensis TaxID=589403 RepID=A0ABR7WDR4_9ACTN|nr:nitroreductase family protein [Gordonia hankookensis]MBD1320921.1 nitroreductase family protein [Gordonia hankookensis]